MTQRTLIALVAAGLLAWGGGLAAQPVDAESMLIKASALTKVAAAVESAVRFKDAPVTFSEAELLEFATRHDPAMLEAFSGYMLRARRVGNLSSVLLCTADRQTALIEDAGCTGPPDRHYWNEIPRPACVFGLDLPAVCPKP